MTAKALQSVRLLDQPEMTGSQRLALAEQTIADLCALDGRRHTADRSNCYHGALASSCGGGAT